MLKVIAVISPLFLIIFATAIVQKYYKIGDDWSKVLNEFALKIGLPVLIFASLAKTKFNFSLEAPLIIANSIFVVSSLVLAYIIGKSLKLKTTIFRTFFICFAFSNIAYLGIPVLTEIQGAEVLPRVSLIVGIYLFWIFTIGIGYLEYSIAEKNQKIIKKIFFNLIKNPLLLSGVFGILIGALHLQLPEILLKSMEMVQASVTPTVLIVIGLFIGKSSIGKLKEWVPIFLFSLLIIMLLPAMFYFGLKIFSLDPKNFSTSIIESAMPLAITPFALADKYKLDKKFIARSIVLSTLLSVISLPFWISLL